MEEDIFIRFETPEMEGNIEYPIDPDALLECISDDVYDVDLIIKAIQDTKNMTIILYMHSESERFSLCNYDMDNTEGYLESVGYQLLDLREF